MRSLALLAGFLLLSAGTAVAGITYDPVCLDACDADLAYCYQTTPECAEVDYCDVCENAASSCRTGCQRCTDPLSQTTITNNSATNIRWVGAGCYGDAWFDLYSFYIRTCTGTRTTYCDGRTEDSWGGFCYNQGPYGCSLFGGGACFGGGSPPAACPFF